MGADTLGIKAFLSRRVVTPQGIRHAAVLVEEERIRAVILPAEIPPTATCEDFGDLALLPGLVDSHVHINEPGPHRVGRIRLLQLEPRRPGDIPCWSICP